METLTDLYPMYGLWHQPWWQTRQFLYLLGAVAIIVFSGILWLLMRWLQAKRNKKQPWEVALMRIEELTTLLAVDEHFAAKDLYIYLTIILKNYLYHRYGFDVESKTDDELILFLEHTSLHKDLLGLFREIFEHGSQAKFAQSSIAHSYMLQDLSNARDIIKKTIPVS